MSITQPWNIVFFVGFVLYVGIRGRFARQTKTNEKIVRQVDMQEKVLLPTVISTSLLLPVLYLFTPLLRFADYQLPAGVQWSGLAVMVAALWLFWRSHVDLGLNWSATLEIRKGHQIIRDGVYLVSLASLRCSQPTPTADSITGNPGASLTRLDFEVTPLYR